MEQYEEEINDIKKVIHEQGQVLGLVFITTTLMIVINVAVLGLLLEVL